MIKAPCIIFLASQILLTYTIVHQRIFTISLGPNTKTEHSYSPGDKMFSFPIFLTIDSVSFISNIKYYNTS